MRGQKDIMARRGRQRGGQWPFVLGACSDIFLQVWVVVAKIRLVVRVVVSIVARILIVSKLEGVDDAPGHLLHPLSLLLLQPVVHQLDVHHAGPEIPLVQPLYDVADRLCGVPVLPAAPRQTSQVADELEKMLGLGWLEEWVEKDACLEQLIWHLKAAVTHPFLPTDLVQDPGGKITKGQLALFFFR